MELTRSATFYFVPRPKFSEILGGGGMHRVRNEMAPILIRPHNAPTPRPRESGKVSEGEWGKTSGKGKILNGKLNILINHALRLDFTSTTFARRMVGFFKYFKSFPGINQIHEQILKGIFNARRG